MEKSKTLWYVNPKKNQKWYPFIKLIKLLLIIAFPIVLTFLKKIDSFNNNR